MLLKLFDARSFSQHFAVALEEEFPQHLQAILPRLYNPGNLLLHQTPSCVSLKNRAVWRQLAGGVIDSAAGYETTESFFSERVFKTKMLLEAIGVEIHENADSTLKVLKV